MFSADCVECIQSVQRAFLESCFVRDPDLRPSAADLLLHPFVRDATPLGQKSSTSKRAMTAAGSDTSMDSSTYTSEGCVCVCVCVCVCRGVRVRSRFVLVFVLHPSAQRCGVLLSVVCASHACFCHLLLAAPDAFSSPRRAASSHNYRRARSSALLTSGNWQLLIAPARSHLHA